MTVITVQSVEEHTLLRQDLVACLKEHFASATPWLRNPALPDQRYRAAIWMHGTLARFRVFRRARRREHNDWDGCLGTHFTNSTWSAQMYAIGEIAHRPRAGGRIAVCLLRAHSPITFELRSQVTVSALLFGLGEKLIERDHVRASGDDMRKLLFGPFAMSAYGFQEEDFPTAIDALLSGEEPPGESLEAGSVIAMAVLNKLPQMGPRYVEHLRSRGHDSIVCDLSDPMETVAIVFDAKQIELVEWQPAWDAVLARVLEVRRTKGDENILRTALTDSVASARRASGRRRGDRP